MLPFDIAQLRIIFYEPDLQENVAVSAAIEKALHEYESNANPAANPVRAFLENIGVTSNPASNEADFEQELYGRIARARSEDQLIAVWRWAQNLSPKPALALLSLADRLANHQTWNVSVEVLRAAVAARPNDFEVHRQLGWHLRHLGTEQEAVAELKKALALNDGDPEALGMLGGILKRRGDFEEAARLYDRGAQLSPDSLYMLVNQAAMAILVNPETPERGISLYQALRTKLVEDSARQADMWTQLVAGEAAFAMGNMEMAEEHFRRAAALRPEPKDLRSAADQVELLGKSGFRSEEATHVATYVRSLALLDQVTSSPVSAEAMPIIGDVPVIIHLSDLHFGAREVEGKPVVMHRFFEGDYEKELSAHIIDEFASRHRHFGYETKRLYLVVSGDLTYRGEREEFEQADRCLTKIQKGLGIPKERVVLVPGNHDVHWPLAGVQKSYRFDNYLTFLRKFYGNPLFRKLYPRINWDFRVSSPRPKPSDIVSVCHDSSITVVGMNSCVYETNQDHYGFVGGRQLDSVGDLIEERGGSAKDFRVAVLHHHLHPFPEPVTMENNNQVWTDLSTIRDAGLVERRLERLGFDLVLHGHKHKAQLRESLVHDGPKRSRQRLIVCGAGSTGVNGKELEHNYSNHYEVLEVVRLPRTAGVDFLSVEWRELALVPGSDWATTQRWVLEG